MMRLAVCSPVGQASLDRQLREIEGVELVWSRADELPQHAAESDAIVLPAANYAAAIAEALRRPNARCQWLQLLSAGFEQLITHGVPESVAVSNAGSVWSPIVAEHAMLLLLSIARRLPKVLAAQAKSEWDEAIRLDMSLLIGGRLVIVGMGSIGTELARRARAFGMTTVGVTRSGRPHADADEMFPVARLHEALRGADFVVVAVPLSPATQGLIGAPELAACPSHAVIVNVGRGPVIDSAALHRALLDGVIAGAGLDVTDPEPLPSESPLWRLPNVIVSPHIGGAAPERYNERLVSHVVANVRARLAHTPINDRVDVAGASA